VSWKFHESHSEQGRQSVSEEGQRSQPTSSSLQDDVPAYGLFVTWSWSGGRAGVRSAPGWKGHRVANGSLRTVPLCLPKQGDTGLRVGNPTLVRYLSSGTGYCHYPVKPSAEDSDSQRQGTNQTNLSNPEAEDNAQSCGGTPGGSDGWPLCSHVRRLWLAPVQPRLAPVQPGKKISGSGGGVGGGNSLGIVGHVQVPHHGSLWLLMECLGNTVRPVDWLSSGVGSVASPRGGHEATLFALWPS
jgi:hypothetical protein